METAEKNITAHLEQPEQMLAGGADPKLFDC